MIMAGGGFAVMAWREAQRRTGITVYKWMCPWSRDMYMLAPHVEYYRILDDVWLAFNICRKWDTCITTHH